MGTSVPFLFKEIVMSNVKELVNDLRVVQNGTVEDIRTLFAGIDTYASRGRTLGLCTLIVRPEVMSDLISKLIKSWPKFSGLGMFPVPSQYRVNPLDAYDNALRSEDKAEAFYGDHLYGNNRRELAGFLADKLEEVHHV